MRRLPDGGEVRAARGAGTVAAARAGLTARGVIYFLVGVLALRVALTGGGEQADRGGAVEELADKPLGGVLVWAVGIGLVGMALWRLSEAVFGAAGPDGGKARERLFSAVRFVFYCVVAGTVLAFAAGERESGAGSTDEQSRDVTTRMLGWPGGQWLPAAAGPRAGRRLSRRRRGRGPRTAAPSARCAGPARKRWPSRGRRRAVRPGRRRRSWRRAAPR
ncbi:DUF1206 domain-containing protein [Streptomyces cinnamoneus]